MNQERLPPRIISTPLLPGQVHGLDPRKVADVVFVNAPLRDYAERPRTNDFTLPVLGMAYIATYCKSEGYNVGVLDAEALGLGVPDVIDVLNTLQPRWAGFNLLAPTYELSARIASQLSPDIKIMVGGHHAKAMPAEIVADERFGRLTALLVGEAETRVAALLGEADSRQTLPGVWWRDPVLGTAVQGGSPGSASHLAPDIEALPFVDRSFLVQDPFRAHDGRMEANLVGARGCPYNCTFCGAAAKSNPDVKIRTRSPASIIEEMDRLQMDYAVTAFRFVDDLFLGYPRFIADCSEQFARARIGEKYVWDATGRINILHKLSDGDIRALVDNGCREVALGIESGSERLLAYMDKRLDVPMIKTVVERLLKAGISVKGYFIFGFPTETRAELDASLALVQELWALSDRLAGSFRASAFEFRPYPGTLEWNRLIEKGQFTREQLLDYAALDLSQQGLDETMRGRDEFNFSVNLQFGSVDIAGVRKALVQVSREQYARRRAA